MTKAITDSTIIWNFLQKEFKDDHPVIYLYSCGNVRSPQTAIDKAMAISIPIFSPPISEYFVKTIIKGFLEMKKEKYKKGEIKIKPLY